MCLRYEFRLPLFTLPTGKSKPHLQSRTTYLEFRYREFQFTFPTIKFATRVDFNTPNTHTCRRNAIRIRNSKLGNMVAT